MNSSTEHGSPQGKLRRLFAAWRRLEEAMDYGPFDYRNDRLRGLEVRIEQVERTLAAVLTGPSAGTLSSTVPATSSDHR